MDIRSPTAAKTCPGKVLGMQGAAAEHFLWPCDPSSQAPGRNQDFLCLKIHIFICIYKSFSKFLFHLLSGVFDRGVKMCVSVTKL